MKYLKNTLIPLLAGVILFSSIIEARDTKNKAGRYFGASSLPTDYEQFDVNQWTIDTSNDGRIAVNNVRGIGGEWRKTGVFLIYAQSWWFAGKVNGELRVAGNEFSADMEVGPYGGNPNDPSVRTYNVKKSMLADPLAFLDFQEWPADQGAPWVDVDGDGVYTPLPAGTDHPEFIGDQVIWSIQNDGVASKKAISSGLPTNVEVRTTMFGFDRPDAFGDIVFVKHDLRNPTSDDVTDAYLGVWSDPDNGDYLTDLIGVDPELSLGYCYNAGDDDEWLTTDYGPGPAYGVDFFQGPAVPCTAEEISGGNCPGAKQFGQTLPNMKNLGLSGYNLFINGDAVFGDADEPDEFYFALQGLKTDGTQLGPDITGATCTPETVADGTCTNPYVNCEGVAAGGTCYSNFSFWGDPAVDPDADGDGTVTAAELALNPIDGYVRTPDDRRFLQSIGPFTLEAGAQQEIVYGLIGAYSPTSSVASIAALKQVDALAQLAYDIDFALPASPPSPTMSALPMNQSVMLSWDSGAVDYSATSQVDLDENGDATDFEFEGYKVYQYANDTKSNPVLIATFDVANGVTEILDTVFDANYGVNVTVPVAAGTDSGLQQTLQVNYDYQRNTSLKNNNEYYFGVSSYGYNAYGIPKMLESSTRLVSVRPSTNQMVDDAASMAATATVVKEGLGDGRLNVQVVNPSLITGDTYSVTFEDQLPDGRAIVNWSMTNTTTGDVKLSNIVIQDGVNPITGKDFGTGFGYVVDGMKVSVSGPQAGHKGMYEIKEVDVPRYNEAIAAGEVLDSTPSYANLNSSGSFSLSVSKGVWETRAGYGGTCSETEIDAGTCTSDLPEGTNSTTTDGFAPIWDNDPYEYMTTDDVVLDFSKTQVAFRYPYSFARPGYTIVPFAAYRSVNGVMEQLHVRWNDIDGDGTWSDKINYNNLTTLPSYLRLAEGSGITKGELDALNNNVEDKAAPWYDVYSGPHYSAYGTDNIAWEPFAVMGYTTEPYDPAKEAEYMTYTDGIDAGACEAFHGYWYYYGYVGADCTAQVTTPIMTGMAAGQAGTLTPSGGAIGSPNNGMYYGVYAGPFIYGQYMNTADVYEADPVNAPGVLGPMPSVWGCFDSGPPTQQALQDVRDCYSQYGYAGNPYTGAGAMVILNNKINTSNVSFTLDSSQLLPPKKKFDLANITAWPNPYYGAMKEETNQYDQRVMFSNLPSAGETVVRIFSVDGTLVRLLKHNDTGSQHMTWDLNNEYGLPVASGMYFAHVSTRGEEKVLKLAIVQPEMRIDTY
tara:strand:- start:2052 stop:5867 length:3816 start_codon:yes stop_codon:yes gene_type:complete